MVVEVIVWGCLAIGAIFSIIGGFGIIRLPEFYSRMHAGGITDTMGAAFIVGGLMVLSGFSLTTLKLLMIIFFLLITSPTACHALARSALGQGLKPELEINTVESNKQS